MKFLGAGIALTYMAASVAAFQNLETADKQLNISSPLVQGNYVAGQMLPLIYIPTGNPPSKWSLSSYIMRNTNANLSRFGS